MWAALVVVGAVVLVGFTMFLYERALTIGARLAMSGRTTQGAGGSKIDSTAGSGSPRSAGTTGNLEYEAAQRAYDKVVDRGAEELMAADPSLTKKQARARAEKILEETGAFSPTGGIPSP